MKAAIRTEYILLYLALIFGPVIAVLTPPFQGADEHAHLLRAYQLSECMVGPETTPDNRVGGFLPRSLASPCFDPFWKMPWDRSLRMDKALLTNALSDPLQANDRRFLDFPNTAKMPPAPYLPQAVAVILALIANPSTPPILLLYFARFFNLAAWIALMVLAVKLAPTGKWIFAGLALMPGSIYQASTLSPDAATNALSFVVTAYALNLAMAEDHAASIGRKQILLFSLAATLLALSKFVYLPLVFLFLLVPAERLGPLRRRVAAYLIAVGVPVLCWTIWTLGVSHTFVSYADYSTVSRDSVALIPGTDAGLQLRHVLSTPAGFVMSAARAICSRTHGESFLGWHGWDMVLPGWTMVLIAGILFWLLVLNTHPASGGVLRPAQRGFLLATAIAVGTGICIAQYLTWTPVGLPEIHGIHGRYFVPVAPALFLAFHFPVLNPGRMRILIPLALCVALCATCAMIVLRYY